MVSERCWPQDRRRRVGTQGGFVEETVLSAFAGWGTMAINSSSGIIFADDPAMEAKKLKEQMYEVLQTHMGGFPSE